MLEITNLSKNYGDKKILNNINLSINSGKVVGIIGPNGAGKTTMIKILANLIKPTTGEIYLNNSKYHYYQDTVKIKKQIGYLGDQSLLYEHLSPIENLKFFTKLYNLNYSEKEILNLINYVELSFFRYDPIKTFSKGMIQRLAIARATIHRPNLFLLDEPYSGLDQKGIKLLNQIIKDYKNKDKIILLITHDFEQAANICDRIISLDKGRVVDDFSVDNKSKEYLLNRYENRDDIKC